MFQSAPRLGAAENDVTSIAGMTIIVSIRSAAWGRGEPVTIILSRPELKFQSAPRLGAAENIPGDCTPGGIIGFNPLRGLGPRRTALLLLSVP